MIRRAEKGRLAPPAHDLRVIPLGHCPLSSLNDCGGVTCTCDMASRMRCCPWRKLSCVFCCRSYQACATRLSLGALESCAAANGESITLAASTPTIPMDLFDSLIA